VDKAGSLLAKGPHQRVLGVSSRKFPPPVPTHPFPASQVRLVADERVGASMFGVVLGAMNLAAFLGEYRGGRHGTQAAL
jgi:hypothetical protein